MLNIFELLFRVIMAFVYFGPKRFAFWAKLKCILGQNGLCFAAKWIMFCRKMDHVLPQNGSCFAAKWIVIQILTTGEMPCGEYYKWS